MSYRLGLLAALVFLVTMFDAAAQTYSIEVSSGSYADLAGAVVVSSDTIEETYYVDIPFAFKAFGESFTFALEGCDATFERSGFLYAANYESGRTWVFHVFLAYLGMMDTSSSMSYLIEGSGNDRVLKFQWKNMKLTRNPEGDFLNVQFWIFERTSDIEVHVGPHRITGLAALGDRVGPAIGHLIADNGFDSFYHFAYLTGPVGNPTMDTTRERKLGGIPPNGTIYRFRNTAAAGVAASASEGTIGFNPNPAREMTWIALPGHLANTIGTLRLYDALGREALVLPGVTRGATVPTAGLPAGVYHGEFTAAHQRFRTGMLIVR